MLLASVMRRGPLWHLARGVRRDQVTDDLPAPVFVNGLEARWFQLRVFGEHQRGQGQDSIARDPRDQEGSIHRDWAERREDEHQQVESHQRSGGDYPSTVSQDDQLLLAIAIIA
jgi:hypothetical protein